MVNTLTKNITYRNKTYQIWLYRLTGFFSIFTAFYFDLGPINIRANDLFYYIVFIYSFLIVIKNFRIKSSVSFLSVALSILVIIFYTFNIARIVEYNDVFAIGAIKFFLNRISWLLAYIIIIMVLGKCFCKEFLIGFIFGALFCVILMTFELFYFLNTGEMINYSFLQGLGIMTEPYKGISNQGLLRPTGVTMDCNYSAAYAILAALIIDEMQLITKNWILGIIKLFLILSAFAVQSRTAVFGLIAVFLLSVLLKPLNWKLKIIASKQLIILIICSIFAFIYLLNNMPEIFERSIQRVLLTDSSSGTRMLYIHQYEKEMSKKEDVISRFLFGNGTGSSGFTLADVGYGKQNYWAPESNYLTFFIEQGIIFVVIFSFIVGLSFFKLSLQKTYLHLIFFYLLIIGATYNFLGDRVWWLILLILMSLPKISKQESIFL